MEKRIELERRARKISLITELNLDNCRSTSIVGLTEYTALETLSLINVGLTTLKGFPKLPNLKKLELSDNRISNGLNYLTTSPKLEYLNLCANKIKDLETIQPLQEFKNLAILDLFNNEVTQIENYREKIFAMLPSLKFLDGFDCNDVDQSDGDDDEEVIENDSENDDKQNVFCLNGLEIDLNELEEFEKHLQAKRKLQQQQRSPAPTMSINDIDNCVSSSNSNRKEKTVSNDGAGASGGSGDDGYVYDDLDEYLKQMELKEKNVVATKELPQRQDIQGQQDTVAISEQSQQQQQQSLQNFALFLYWFLAILNLASAAFYRYSDGSGEEEEDGDEDDLSEENSSVSLDEVYNDDLEEDNSEWDEEGAPGEEEDDDDVDSDEEDADASNVLNESTASKTAPSAAATATAAAGKDGGGGGKENAAASGKAKENVNNVAAAAAAEDKDAEAVGEESQARGKKRKHDG